MSERTNIDSAGAPPPTLPVDIPHWNDLYLTTDPSQYPLKGNEAPDELVNAAGEHYSHLWNQQQTLLELAVARMESRETPLDEASIAEQGLPIKILTSNYYLVDEFYKHLGPHNEMAGSDVLLTNMAGLVVDELLPRNETSVFTPQQSNDPFIRSVGRISAYAEMMKRSPDLTEGKEKQLLLIAELLSEAHRVPNPVRGKVTSYQEFTGDLFDERFYRQSVVSMCEAVAGNLTDVRSPLPENASKRQLRLRSELLASKARAVQTKYDVLFDAITEDTPFQVSAGVFKEFAQDAAETLSYADLDVGFAYELFAPLAFRYAALRENRLGIERVWQATMRSDTPKDLFGFRAASSEDGAENAATNLKKQSSDMAIGTTNETHTSSNVTHRYQLKARADAQRYEDEYDSTYVDIHYEDATWLLEVAHAQLRASESTYEELDEISKIKLADKRAKDIMVALIQEMSSRVDESPSRSTSYSAEDKDSDALAISYMLDEVVLPVYHKMMSNHDESVTKERTEVSYSSMA